MTDSSSRPSHDQRTATPFRILRDGESTHLDDEPQPAAAAADLLAQAADCLREVERILRNELPSLGECEASRNSKSALRVHHTPMESPTTKTPKYLSLAEVAAVLNLDSRSLRRLRRDPTAKFPAARQFGRALRWKADEIDAWAERQRSKS